jgi:PAS domain S-box-containing protein
MKSVLPKTGHEAEAIVKGKETAVPQNTSEYDDFVRLATILCGTPAAYIVVQEGGRPKVLACTGLEPFQIFEASAFHFCGLEDSPVIVISDTRTDSEHIAIPITVIGAPIRFYAAARLLGAGGQTLGVLCAVDHKPHEMSSLQRDGLGMLANQVAIRLQWDHEKESGGKKKSALAKEDLQEAGLSEERFRLMIENESDILTILDPDGRVRYATPSIERVLGYRPDEILGTNTFNYIHPDDVSARYEALANGIGDSSPAPPVVFRFRHKDGSWRYLEAISRSLLDDPTIHGILVDSRDVTERRLSEERLRLLESVVVNARDSVVITQVDPSDYHGSRIVYVNEAFTRMTGYAPEEVIGRTPRLLQGPKTDRDELAKIRASLKRWEPVRTELINYCKDGTEYCVEMDIVPVADERGWYTHWVAVQRDITERKHAEESLRRIMAGAQCLLWYASVEDLGRDRLRWDMQFPDEEAAKRFLPVEVAPGQSYASAWRASRLSEDLDRTDLYGTQQVRAGKSYRQVFRCRRLDGAIRWLSEEVFVEPIGEDLWRSVGVCTDITEQKLAEDALKDSESRYQSLVENVPVCVYRKDLEGRFTFGNSQFESVLGKTEADYIGKTDFDLFPEALAQKYARDDQYVIESREVYEDSEEHAGSDGHKMYVRVFKTPVFDAKGSVVGTQGIFWDITERKQTELALEQKTAIINLLQQVATAANEASTLEEAAQLCVDFICKHKGWPVGHMYVPGMPGQPELVPSLVWHVEDEERYAGFTLSTAEGMQSKRKGILEKMLEDRTPIWVSDVTKEPAYRRREAAERAGLKSMFAFPVLVGTEVAAILEFYTREVVEPDTVLLEVLTPIGAQLGRVVERQNAQEAIQQQSRELARSNSELEQFAYVASHDLQEPLRMVSSYMQLLGRRYKGKLDSDADEFIGYAVDGAARMQSLILDLLAFSRVGTRGSAFEKVDCETVFERTLANLKLAVDESGGAVTHDPLPTVTGDPLQLGQLFQNLIGNALKFRGDAAPQIHISAKKNGSEWQFTVKDNGIGIAPQYADRIFIIFQRLHRKEDYPGTGIGLAICKKIVERHGGAIRMESQPGEGTTFFFTLPA